MTAVAIPTRVAALARLELGDVLRSRWLIFCGALYAALAALFIGIGLHESAVMGFTGMARVLLSLTHALVVLLPLLALTGTGLVVARARGDGTLELLFSQPITRDEYFSAVTLVRFGALFAPLLVLMPGLAVFGALAFHQAVPWGFLARAIVVSAALLWSFTGLGLAVSVRVRELDRVMMYLLVIWVLSVALLDLGLVGLMLQWQLPAPVVFTLAGLNPVETARLALLSGAEPSLGTLGPVGFFLHRTLGATWLFVAGVTWPLAVGTFGWLAARRRLRAGDLI
ncbi:MAG TPA: ABC transporter permease subunit [Gemmatimonadales bacterium]|nr:ABC transporter permease subunit [Gemmatimonadales bacterium]